MKAAYVFLYILILILITPYILCLFDKLFKTHYSCTVLGWHDGKGKLNKTFDGCSVHSTCSKCGIDVMQDSQGNWF